jgi:hypothetical protein
MIKTPPDAARLAAPHAMPITESAYPHDDFARLRAYPARRTRTRKEVVSEYHRTAALEGFEALFAAVGLETRGL